VVRAGSQKLFEGAHVLPLPPGGAAGPGGAAAGGPGAAPASGGGAKGKR
jgi:hypothetical protein